MIALLLALQTKHFIADWLFQPRYMHQNKGKLGHPGGLAHSAFHALLTGFILIWFVQPEKAWMLAALEFGAHYLIDWSKMNMNRLCGFVPLPVSPYRWPQSEAFWIFLGFDQWLHQLCYVVIIFVATN